MADLKDFADKPLEDVAYRMARSGAGSHDDQVTRAEFLLRQTQFLERQAIAAEKTAVETSRYTRYMFWSVVVLAASSVLSLLVQLSR